MNTVVYIQRPRKKDGYWKTFIEETGNEEKGLFGKKPEKQEVQHFIETGEKDEMVNMGEFMQQVEEKVQELNAQGYEIVSVLQNIEGAGHVGENEYKTPIRRVHVDSAGYGFGYSYMCGVTLFLKKRSE